MGKYLLPAMFVLILGMSAAVYAYIVFDLDGSTMTTKHKVAPPEGEPTR